MLAKLKRTLQDWTAPIPTISSAQNETIHITLGHRSDVIALIPLEGMTRSMPKRPIIQILKQYSNSTEGKMLEQV